jgi:sulfatase modifying factor 1
VIIGGGGYWMGPDDGERQPVTLTVPFRILPTELTQAQWAAITGAAPAAGCPTGPELPVVCVTWREAVEAANQLSAAHGLRAAYQIDGDDVRWDPSASGWRLPTEAEWEFVARARGSRWLAGRALPRPDVRGRQRVDRRGRLPLRRRLRRAGPRSPRARANPYGVYDLAGNAAEWVWDREGPPATRAQADPTGSATGDRRLVKGGHWRTPAARLTPGAREAEAPSTRREDVGVRFARSIVGDWVSAGKPGPTATP